MVVTKETYAELEKLNPGKKIEMSAYMKSIGMHKNSITKIRKGMMLGEKSIEAIRLMIVDLGLVVNEGRLIRNQITSETTIEQLISLVKSSETYKNLPQIVGEDFSALIKTIVNHADENMGNEED